MQLLCPVTCGEKPPMKSISLPTPFKYNSQHKCADMAEGAINLIADYLFPAAPGARQRGDVRIAGEEADVTADGFAWLVPGSWRKSALLTWRGWGQERDGSDISGHSGTTNAVAISASVSGTGILPLLTLPGLKGCILIEGFAT